MGANQLATCLRHQSYPTRESAQTTARMLRRRGRSYARVEAFKCPFKGEDGAPHWHVGRRNY